MQVQHSLHGVQSYRLTTAGKLSLSSYDELTDAQTGAQNTINVTQFGMGV